jgi:hypothetical protein
LDSESVLDSDLEKALVRVMNPVIGWESVTVSLTVRVSATAGKW